MKKDIKKNKEEYGLPEVAQNRSRKNHIVMGMIGVVTMLCFSMYFMSKSNKKAENFVEEIYNIPAPFENKKEQLVSAKILPPVAAPVSEISQQAVQEQADLIEEKKKELQQRLSAPLMLVNANQTNTAAISTAQSRQGGSKDPNTQFIQQVASQSVDSVEATSIGSLNSIIAEGSLIHATLESASNSDLPGYLRAIVSVPIYSEDGSQILIPPGSRLIGQYKSGMLQGQSRIFIVWTRLITPKGVSINLGSAGIDSLGVAGIGADEIDRHFWQRFGTGSLLSLFGVGAANIGAGQDQDNPSSIYRSAIAASFAQSASQSLQQDNMVAPTLKTYQGKPIIVFVAHDLHFHNVMKTIKPKINIF